MLKRQSQTPPVQSNFTPQNSNALGRLSGSAAAANSIDLQQDAILGAFLLSSTLSAAALAVLNDINAISGTGYSGPASPLPTSTGDAVSGDANFQTTVTADTSNVSSGAPFALTEHASGDSGQNVADTGTTINSGGIQVVEAGGTASSTTINSGGFQYDYGTATGTTVNGGGIEYVFSGGTAGGTTLSGGTEIVMSGGIANGTITFAGSGQLTFNISTNLNNFQISGFNTSPEKLDLTDIAYGGNTTLSFVEANNNTSGTLTVSDTVHTANITVLGLYTTQNFTTASDGHGGTIIFV